MNEYNIFVGYDPREDEAWEVCKYSLCKHSSQPLKITPLLQSNLRTQGLYWREHLPHATTEFGFTRFLVPKLMNYKGWALYCDCDFLWTSDVIELFRLARTHDAILCVKHNYSPKETIKMDNKEQDNYNRKNWSSLVLWNCEHPSNKYITVAIVNSVSKDTLNSFSWLNDNEIGSLDETWNWLEGWSKVSSTLPKAIHFTRGGPWFENCQNVMYADLYYDYKEELNAIYTYPNR